MTANGSGLAMKMVVAIIRHERLQEVQDVLDECGVSGVTVTEVKGCGAQRGYTEKYRGAAVHISLRPRIKVEAVMRSEIVDTVVDKLAVAGRHGDAGNKKAGGRFTPPPVLPELVPGRGYFRALLDPCPDRARAAGVADQPVDQPSLPEQAERRDSHHAVADGDLLVVVDVELADLD